MNKKVLIIVLIALIFLTLNFTSAQDIDNTTEIVEMTEVEEVQSISNESFLEASTVDTHFNVESTTEFDVIGDYFKVKLADVNNNPIANAKVTFTVNGANYNKNTDSAGIASLQIRLNDGAYNIVSKFAGNSKYKSSSLSTRITMDNTREVESGLSNSQIQNIIDNAKSNNVILFKGSSYSNINLVITKCLKLQSNVNTVLKSNSGQVITIKGKSASLTTIKGFNIQSGGDGIVINSADYVTITKNDITGKGNGIVATGTTYLNISNNNILKNSKSGIVLGDVTSTYIFNNKINSNGADGIELGKSSKTYIHDNIISSNAKNGIKLTNTVNGKNYGSGPQDVYINKNTVSKNGENGIYSYKAGNNINIKGNSIDYNVGSGISITNIGNNVIQSNVISNNGYVGIKFNDEYVKPKNQEISYNAIVGNGHREVEAKETYYNENGQRLEIGENWYSDVGLICPKIKTNNIRFVVTQISSNQFQASFLDSNGNIASLLPDRTLSYRANNGQSITLTISGGIVTFTVDANDGDLIKATVDSSRRDNTYDSNTRTNSKVINGQTPAYNYPSIPSYQLYEDIGSAGNGNGDSNGDGTDGDANNGNGASKQDSRSNGNSTHSQRADPSNSANNQVNDVEQSYETQTTSSEASVSETSTGDAGNLGSQSQSVVKQILLDEDEFFRVAGISFIILLMILTVGFYYREDIKEMNSKR